MGEELSCWDRVKKDILINIHRHRGNKVNIFRSSSFLPFASPGLFSVDPLTSVRRSFQAALWMIMMILLFLLVMMMMMITKK